MVQRIAAANPRTVVVVNSGAPVLLPWGATRCRRASRVVPRSGVRQRTHRRAFRAPWNRVVACPSPGPGETKPGSRAPRLWRRAHTSRAYMWAIAPTTARGSSRLSLRSRARLHLVRPAAVRRLRRWRTAVAARRGRPAEHGRANPEPTWSRSTRRGLGLGGRAARSGGSPASLGHSRRSREPAPPSASSVAPGPSSTGRAPAGCSSQASSSCMWAAPRRHPHHHRRGPVRGRGTGTTAI